MTGWMRALTVGSLVALLAPAAAFARHHPVNTSDEASRAFLRQVRHSLAASHVKLAHNTLAAIHTGQVQLLTLDSLTAPDCDALMQETQWRDVHERCVATSPGHARPPAAVLLDLVGYQRGNRVYLKPDGDVENAASTLMHEVNHVANHSDAHYATARQVFVAEYRAYWVEHAAHLGHPPDHAECLALKRWILESYQLTGLRASDVTDVPPGNISNAVEQTDGAGI